DIAGKRWLEGLLRATRKTVLVISHDRELLSDACDTIVTLEGRGTWVHGASYATYAEAREHRQELMGNAVARWNEEERRLYRLMKLFKGGARYSPDWAKRANAMESRWRRFADEGPPPAPVVTQKVKIGLRGGDSARRVVDLRAVGVDGLTEPFSDEVHFG